MGPTPLQPFDSSVPIPEADTAQAPITQPTAETEPAQISVPGSILPILPQAAENRANKFSIALPNSSVNKETALNLLLQNREKELRDNASAELDFQKTVDTNQTIQDIISKQSKEGPISLPQQLMIRDLVNRKAANPNTVIEENYAEQFTKKLKQTAADNPNGALAEAFKGLPNYTEAVMKSGTDLKAKFERIQTLTEEAHAALQSQSTTGWIFDQLKNLTSVYQEARFRNLVKGGISTTFGGALGTNLEAQWQDLLFKPFDEFDENLTRVTKNLISDNPSAALFFLSAAHGLSTEDRLLTNMAPILDFGLATDLIGGTAKLANVLRLRTIANRSAQTIIDSSETIASKAGIAEATGDLKGAAIEQFSNEILRGPSEKQVTSVLDDIAGIFETKGLKPLQDMGVPEVNGNMRQDWVNRLREKNAVLYNKFMDRVQNAMKLEQIPAAAAIPRVAARLAEDLVQEYPGLENAIVKNNLFRDTTTGQWFYTATISQVGGKAFSSERVAQSFINAQRLGQVSIKEIQAPVRQIEVKVAGAAKTMSEAEAVDLIKQGDLTSLGTKQPIDFHPDFVPSTEVKPVTNIKQQGAGFYIEKTKPIPLHANYVRDFLLETAETQTPNKILNAVGGILGSLRTPEETLAVQNMINRKLTVYGANQYYAVFKETMKDINNLPGWKLPFTAKREQWKEWKDFISTLDNVANPTTGKKGIVQAFDTPGELRDLYMQIKGHPPSEAEMAATFAYRNQELIREQIQKLTKLKSLYRDGAQNWTLKGLDIDRPLAKAGQEGVIKSVNVNGTREHILPATDDATILFMHTGDLGYQNIYDTHIRNGARLSGSKLAASMQPLLDQGKMKLVRLSEPDSKPLNGMYNSQTVIDGKSLGNVRITHVVSSALEDKLLSLDDIKVNPLPKHDYDHYVVQPHIEYNPVTNKHEYLGDRTIAGFNVRSKAIQIAEGLDTIKTHLKNNEESFARDFHSSSHLPMNYNDIEQWFRPTLAMEGYDEPSRLNLTHKIRVVPNGKLSIEVDKELERHFENVKATTGENFVDRTKETFGQLKTADPYDIFSASNTGTKGNPIWNVAPTKFVDPITSINRGLTRVINDLSLNDYKATSVEHWVQEAKNLLDYSDAQIRSAPSWVFHNPSWKAGLSPVDEMKKLNLMTAQMQIRQFLGIKDVNTTFVHNAAQILADSIYGRLGEGKTLLALEGSLPFLKDPFEFARSMTFHAKVGLFAIPQLIIQMSTIVPIAGIAGWDKAMMATHATMLHTWSRLNRNPEIISHFDQKATAFGFKVGEFKEAFNILESTSFAIPGREQIWRDSTSMFDFIKGPAGTFLDAGQWFYREGERASRTAAFYAAYKEFRELNPVRKVTDMDKRWMLNRADLLNQNMSSASASGLQKGWASLPAQFLSFPIRQAELMLGSRLTPVERMRLFGTYALMYGIPTTLGAFSLGVGGDLAKSSLASGGYVPTSKDNGVLDRIATQGLPAFLGHVATGNLYNVGERYAGGSSPIIDLFRADKHLWDIIGGASGSTVSKSIAGLDGIATAFISAFKGVDKFRFKPEDFIEPLKQISSVNSADRLYTAMQIGKWLSTSEQEMGKVSGVDAIFMTLTGLSKQSASDLGPVMWNKEYEKAIQAKALQTFIKEYRRGLREFEANNPEQGHDYLMRAYRELIIKGYPREDWPKAQSMAISGEETLPNRIMLDYYTKHVPEQNKETRHKAMQQLLRSEQK